MADEEDVKENKDEDAEGEDAEGEEGEEGEGSGGSKLKLFIILGAAVVLIGGAAAAAFFFISGGDDAADEAALEEQAPPEPEVLFFEIPEIVVNLDSAGSARRFLKLKLSLEVKGEEAQTQISQLLPRIQDDFQVYLRSLRIEDLQGSAGIYRLKENLLLRVNQSAHPVKVQRVLIREVLVQ